MTIRLLADRRALREQEPDMIPVEDTMISSGDSEFDAQMGLTTDEVSDLQTLLSPEELRTQFGQLDQLLGYLKRLSASLGSVRSKSYDHGPEGEESVENTVNLASAEQAITDLQMAVLDVLSRLQTVLSTEAPQWVEYESMMNGGEEPTLEDNPEDAQVETPEGAVEAADALPTDDELKFESRAHLHEVAIYGVTDPNQLSLKAVANLMLIYLRSKQAVPLNAALASFKALAKTDMSAAQKKLSVWVEKQFGPMLRWWRDEIAAKSAVIVPEVMNVLISAGSASALTPAKMGTELSRTQQTDQESTPGVTSKDTPGGIAAGQEITGEALVLRRGKWWLGEKRFMTLADAFLDATQRDVAITDFRVEKE